MRKYFVFVISFMFLFLMVSFGNAEAATQYTGKTSVGTVTLYTSDGLESFYKAVLPKFEKEYGAKVNIVTAGSGAIVNRLILQKDNPEADVILTMPPFIQKAEQAGVLTPYNPPQSAKVSAKDKDPQHYWTMVMKDYASFVYNPALMEHPPVTFSDLLKPKLYDKIAYSNPLTAGDGIGMLILLRKTMGEQAAFAYLKRLEKNVKFHTQGTGYLDILISRGEISIANGDVQMDMDDKESGLSLQPFFLRLSADSKPVTFDDPYVIGLVSKAPNPRGGQALINYFFSRAVQTYAFNIWAYPARTDITVKGTNAVKLMKLIKGIQILNVDWNKIARQQEGLEKKWEKEVLYARKESSRATQ